jgi:hypothetical protein
MGRGANRRLPARNSVVFMADPSSFSGGEQCGIAARQANMLMESASASQTLLSASGMMPFHFLSQEDISHALRRHLVLRRGCLFALDQR